MTKALVWPPVDTAHYGGSAGAAAYFSWFFGDVMDQILVPVASEPQEDLHSAYSLGALANLGKVRLLRGADVSGLDHSGALDGLTHVFFTTTMPSPLPGNRKTRRLVGTEKVAIEAGDATAPQHFYIGNPVDDGRDAYLCVVFTYWLRGGKDDAFLQHSQKLLQEKKKSLRAGQPVSVFGTGPSLAEVNPKNHALDASIICNTIVKNKAFCKELNLAAITASDCHFHFSCNQYAFQFLSDLDAVMAASEAIYITFDKFAPFVLNKLPHLRPRTCGIPSGRDTFGFDFDTAFCVLPGESVVNMLMLPVACYLSKDVGMCGFTGRSPNDSFFWSHSDNFQYQDLLPTVRSMHPGFFTNRDYDAYANVVGQQLSHRAGVARDRGVSVRSFTTSFYPGLERNKGKG